MRTLKLGVAYFAAVFGVGFILGVIRSLWVTPRLGELTAELIEAPVMLGVIITAALWLVRRTRLASWHNWLHVGLIAMVLLLLAEFSGVMWLRGVTIRDYFAARHVLATVLYFALVAVFAVAPAVLSTRTPHDDQGAA